MTGKYEEARKNMDLIFFLILYDQFHVYQPLLTHHCYLGNYVVISFAISTPLSEDSFVFASIFHKYIGYDEGSLLESSCPECVSSFMTFITVKLVNF